MNKCIAIEIVSVKYACEMWRAYQIRFKSYSKIVVCVNRNYRNKNR